MARRRLVGRTSRAARCGVQLRGDGEFSALASSSNASSCDQPGVQITETPSPDAQPDGLFSSPQAGKDSVESGDWLGPLERLCALRPPSLVRIHVWTKQSHVRAKELHPGNVSCLAPVRQVSLEGNVEIEVLNFHLVTGHLDLAAELRPLWDFDGWIWSRV